MQDSSHLTIILCSSVIKILISQKQKVNSVVTQFKIQILNFRYRHNSAPNVKVLAARLGTASGNMAGGETGSRGWLMGVGHFCLVFRNEHTLRRAIQVSQICKLNPNQLHYRSE
jgi:hypothetical protein